MEMSVKNTRPLAGQVRMAGEQITGHNKASTVVADVIREAGLTNFLEHLLKIRLCR